VNFIAQESQTKLRGGFYTEASIASFLTRWVQRIKPTSILEPSCGDGNFLAAIRDQISREQIAKVDFCELDESEAAKASVRTELPADLVGKDFLTWYLLKGRTSNRYDAVLGNPPFIRYQYLPKQQQLLAERIFKDLHLKFTKHTNAWVPFVVASINLLRPGGRLAMVVPSEILHIPHAQGLRTYLANQCSRIAIVDPKKLWFADALQGTVLLLAERKEGDSARSEGVAIISDLDNKLLGSDPEEIFQRADYTNGETISGKWMKVLLTRKERSLVNSLIHSDLCSTFGDLASVDVGIVTGANKFFLVPQEVVDEFDLHEWAHPMFGRSDHVNGLVYSTADHERNRKRGAPSSFLWFKSTELDPVPENVASYFATGLAQSLDKRFKCRTRKCWYEVPSVYASHVALLKRAHHFPRLIFNKAKAYSTDTAYRIQCNSIDPKVLVSTFVNSLTALSCELEGRHYGGGVLELVPSEIERLAVPLVDVPKTELVQIDREFRCSSSQIDFLKRNDDRILGLLGLSSVEIETLHNAWSRLRDRRQRIN
jgi:adenine-specific DNA methylase